MNVAPRCRLRSSMSWQRLVFNQPKPAARGGRRAPLRPTMATSSSTQRAGVAPNSFDSEAATKRATQLFELLQEATRITLSTGPRGVLRAITGATAVSQLMQEYLTSGQFDRPERILRRLFERLGATYIKLGQFIASTPSLFPDEYVTEFQQCLDKTEPVPYDTIRAIIASELKQPIEEVFASIESTPLASASVAQVGEGACGGHTHERGC